MYSTFPSFSDSNFWHSHSLNIAPAKTQHIKKVGYTNKWQTCKWIDGGKEGWLDKKINEWIDEGIVG